MVALIRDVVLLTHAGLQCLVFRPTRVGTHVSPFLVASLSFLRDVVLLTHAGLQYLVFRPTRVGTHINNVQWYLW